MRTVSAADANRHFSSLLQEVKAGTSITVTSRGQPVAQITPIDKTHPAVRSKAMDALLTRLRDQPALGISWTRDELYDDAAGE
jgi:prevent-host-death family protein